MNGQLIDFKKNRCNYSNEQIENLSYQKLIEHKMMNVPINPVVITQNLGINVFRSVMQDKDVTGLITKKETTVIYVADQYSMQTKRYIVSHMLGHLFLHLNKQTGNYIDTQKALYTDETEIERQANLFARCFLVPAYSIIQMWNKDYNIKDVAYAHDVSAEVIVKRQEDLKINLRG